ncbi:diguanylate cyclase domain-containing protein [Cetobacterium sp.]|uniref:diguanylate cyclase domain-containing protein n=2 Tax=Cetobacterium sp. TaxID=2071632 RepID=UPI003EE7CA6E
MISSDTKLILNKLSTGIILLDLEKKIIFSNKSIKSFFKGKRNDTLGEYLDCNAEVFKERICRNKINCDNCFLGKAFEKVVRTQKEEIIEGIKFFEDNYEINVDCKLSYNSELKYVILEFLNIDKKHEKFNFFMKAFEYSRDIIFFKNSKLQYIYINETGKKFFNNVEILYKTDEELFPLEIAEQCKLGDLETLKKGKHNVLEFIEDKVFRTSKEYINGGILAVAQDITDEYYAQLLSNTDILTGLYNRKKFDEVYKNIFKSKKENIFLAIIDLDNLRDLNNKYGHLTGDKYLKQLGNILSQYSEGIFFRIGGDEFVGLIEGSHEYIQAIFEKIYEDLRILNLSPKLTISTGIGKINLNETDEINYSKVDKKLYQVKRKGKGKYEII